MKAKKSFALTELIIAIVMIASIISMSLSVYLFFSKQIMINRERYNMLSQINYAFEDMAIRTKSAVGLDPSSAFSLTGNAISDTKLKLKFFGEQDIYAVTPDEEDDNMWYEYSIENGGLILKTFGNLTKPAESITLVDAKYQPAMTFTWYEGYEPNFITVNITTKGTIKPNVQVSRTQGLRFWFIDAKK
ncbi:MAG: type II secretion system protein [Candidatus Omnitrophota bacterium]|jgi:type II secretory pathway pseudopilin PulG